MSNMESESVVTGIINECISKAGLSTLALHPNISRPESGSDSPSSDAVLALSTSQHSTRAGSANGVPHPSTSDYSQTSSGSDKSLSASVYSLLANKSSAATNRTSDPERQCPEPLPSSNNQNTSPSPQEQATSSRNNVSVFSSQPIPSPNIISVLSSQSHCSPSLLVSCDVCTKPCQRAVSLPCCQSQACRACAVKFITSRRVCWGCGEEAATLHIKIEVALREAVKTVASKGALEDAVRKELEGRKIARDKLVKKRKDLGLVVTIAGGTESSSRSVIEISEADRCKQEDQAEMDDIQDKRWKPLRETRTDKERVLLAKKMFGNAVNSDPNRNLSFHGFRSRLALKRGKPYRNHLQPSSFEILQGNLNPLPGFRRVKRNVDGRSVKSNSDLGLREEDVQIRDIPDVMKEVYLKQLQERYSKSYTKEDFKELKRFVGHYVSGFKETSDFFSFYNLGETEKKVSRERLEEMVDVEKLVGEFSKHYGENEKTFCKECKVEHRF